MSLLLGLLLTVIGLATCFFGLRFFRIFMGLQGFITGYFLGSGILASQADVVQIIGSIVIGLIVAFIFYSLYKFAYVVFGALLGLVIGVIIGAAFNLSGVVALIVALVLAVLGGIAGNRWSDTIIRISTSFSGAIQAISGLSIVAASIGIALPLARPALNGSNTEPGSALITFVAVIALGVVGYMFQARHKPATK